jgi:signal transduction histidine kinase
MITGKHLFYEITNLLTLVLTVIYCIKSWLFLKKYKQVKFETRDSVNKLKMSWANEFIIYMFSNVFIFLVLVLVLTNFFGVSTMDMDLIGMPVFMLIVYLLIAIRNMMMFKEYEHQFVLAKLEADKELQQQRLKISRDLHDSLGAQLTFSNSLLDSIRSSAATLDEKTYRKINTLSEFSQNSVSELKSVLWVLNTDEIHLQDLKARMLNLVKDAGDAHENMQIDFDFSFTENSLLSGKQAINLFRVVQEIINNSIKHANAREFSIEVKQAGDWLFLRIKDNGIGFDWEKEKNKSFGLSHIKDRVPEISGQLQVHTGATIGTVYQIKIPLQP